MTLFDANARMRRRRPGLRLKLLMLIELKIHLTLCRQSVTFREKMTVWALSYGKD